MSKGLVTLQTDLKSLRYGNDKPYVTKDINNAPSSNQAGMQATKRIDDLSRIAQMLIDRPGLKHLGNEALLRQVGVQDRLAKSRKSGKSIAGSILKELGGTALATVKVVGSTLAQVPVNGTGTHFLRGFRTDTYLQPVNGSQFSQFAQFFGAGGVEGAPSAIRGEEIVGKVESQFIDVRRDVTSPEGNPAKFTYNAPVNKDGDGGTNWNEKTNTQIVETIPRESSREYSKKGAPIPVGTSAPVQATGRNAETGQTVTIPGLFRPNPLNPNDTTPTSGSLGVPIKGIKGDVTQLEQPDIKPFKEEDQVVKTKGTTKDNVGNAQAGRIIPFFEAGRDTTAAKGDETSLVKGISNHFLDVEPDLPDNGNDGKKRYNSDSTYTGRTSADNIRRALSGKSIFSSIEGQHYTYHNETPYGQTAIAGDSEPVNIGEETSLVKQSIPKETSLKKLREDINLGSAEIVSEDFKKTQIQDFRLGSKTTYSYDYNAVTVNREQRVSLGNQGRSTNKSNYMTVDSLAVDKINDQDISSTLVEGVGDGRDFTKFYFEIITPDGSKFLHFRAFIDSIDDSYSGDWQGRKYNGRAENFYTYGGFDRDISVSFNIAAASRSEMKPLYRKMVYLASATAPTYGTSGLMRGTLAKLTVGSYLAQIPGVLTSVKFSLDSNAPWEIAMGNPDGGGGNSTDDDVQELPMMLKCSISFKAIHDFAPQTGLHHFFTSKKSLNGSKPFFTNGEIIT